ncbi:hypothetical protein P7C71_g3168, partial [Lecanoromycetidae sp. Uapishka_2]
MEGLTLYERKALLVNRELDSHGMGKYQWYIFFLCGFGYLIDLLYAQAFGLIEPAIQQEFGFARRQYAFNLTVLISAVFETLDALTNEDASMSSRNTGTPVLGAGVKQLKATWGSKIKLELVRYKILFSTFNMARLTILVWITYIFDYWGFSIAGGFLPKILLIKNSAIDISVAESYRNFVIIYICGVPGVLLGALMYAVPRVGRKWAMVASSFLMGLSLFLFATVNTEASNIGLNAMEYFFQSMFNAVLYGWTPEAFPAPIRGTASGLASFWGRLFGIVSPLIAADLLAKSLNSPLYLAGGGVFIATIAIILLPTKTMGAQSY